MKLTRDAAATTRTPIFEFQYSALTIGNRQSKIGNPIGISWPHDRQSKTGNPIVRISVFFPHNRQSTIENRQSPHPGEISVKLSERSALQQTHRIADMKWKLRKAAY
jgi:hypothetical protein